MRLGARATTLLVVVALPLAIAGVAVVAQVTHEMRRDADARLDTHAAAAARMLDEALTAAESDIRLGRRNAVFETALADTSGQLLPADRAKVEAAITYLGDRYRVDEICVIRATGLEAARWVSGQGVAAVPDLSPDERANNPAVLPTLGLADDGALLTAPYVSPDSGRWVIGVATPIVLGSASPSGLLHLELPIERFAAQLQETRFSASSFDMLLDRTGHLVIHPRLAEFRAAAGTSTDPATAPFPLATADGSESWHRAVTDIMSGRVGSTVYEDEGRSYRVSYRPLEGTDDIVASVSPAGELYADVDRALLNMSVTAGPLLILMVLAAGWFGRGMARANRGLADLNTRLVSSNTQLEETSRSSAEIARDSAIVNQFTELTALSEDDLELSTATLAALDELLAPDSAALHVSNRSQDRAVPQASLGGREAEVLSLHELGRCPGLRRSSLYVTDDVSARLSFRCPVYPVERGTVACVPLIALGDSVGAVHLHWDDARHLSLPRRLLVTRISEHAALTIANRRLLLALRSQANTDARTGLTNSRAFDQLLERLLADRQGEHRLAVLMLDLDHFKDFNDRYGHPAGDEALRAFGNLLVSSVREHDVVARYGGEEFVVALPDLTTRAAAEVAERIRERTESAIIPLAPGLTGRMTVSIGVAAAPDDGAERLLLLKAADEALYRAKLAGRNRVVVREGWVSDVAASDIDGSERAAS